MQRGKLTRIIPIALVVIIVIIAISALVSLGQSVFRGGDSRTSVDVSRDALLNIAIDRSVTMTVRGPIVADEDFRSYRVQVSSSQRQMTTYDGYLQTVRETKSLGNSTRAYDEFVHALDHANLMKGTAFEGDKDDTRGICATGRVYEFEVLQADQSVKRLWTSTCGGSKGSLAANLDQVRSLFTGQIPDSDALLRTVDL